MPAYLRNLLYLTLGCFITIAVLYLLAGGGTEEESLVFILLALGTFLMWVTICILYSVIVLIRDGRRRSSIPAAVIVGTALIVAISWGVRVAG